LGTTALSWSISMPVPILEVPMPDLSCFYSLSSPWAYLDLARLNHPPARWTLPIDGPEGRPALDVLVVGAGM
jgi:2-hydroxychromene-2-carboxylate isomerase